jgi:hypothetical protein
MSYNRFLSPKPLCFWCMSDEVLLVDHDEFFCRNCRAEWHIENGEPVRDN